MMSTEVPIRTRSRKSKIQPRITERPAVNHKKESPPSPDRFTQFIDYLAQTMPEDERQNFRIGANYAKKIIGNFTPYGFEVSEDTLSLFVAELMHNARDYAQQREYRYNVLDTIEQRTGKALLQLTVPYSSANNPDLAQHFTSFENPYTKIGAFTTLTIAERQQGDDKTVPTELFANSEKHLQSA